MYEIFEHTADLGMRVRAPDFAGVCEEAGRALTEIIAGDAGQIRPTDEELFEVPGAEASYVLFDWLNELLFAFESRRMLFTAFKVTVGASGLHGAARGERYEPGRHALAHEVKAITYHGLEVKSGVGEWEATVIVDI